MDAVAYRKVSQGLDAEVPVEHRDWLVQLGNRYMDMEHYRVADHHSRFPINIAVVITADDCAYFHVARCSDKDQYVKSIGFRIAAGRALKRALTDRGNPDFYVDTEKYAGTGLRDYCREQLRNIYGYDMGDRS